MSCPYAHHDASYVIGALSPAERRGFERHLADCDSCARAVPEVAGLPGLLARVDATELDPPAVEDPVPDKLLPALLRQVRRRQRRHTLATAGLAAAAAAAAVVGALTLTGLAGGQHAQVTGPTPGVPSPATPASAGRPMVSVRSVPVRATVAFHRVPWGTRLDMTCTYNPPAGTYGTTPRPATYLLVVHTRDGHTQQVATWRSLPGRTMRLSAATAASRAQIASVEVRATDGRPVLRLRT